MEGSPTVHPKLAVTPPVLRSTTNKNGAEVEASNLHTPYAVNRCGPPAWPSARWWSRHRRGGQSDEYRSQHLPSGSRRDLTFAVEVSASGFNINTVGIILMLAGGLGLLLSLLFWSSFSPWRRRRTVTRGDTVMEERRIERDLP
jgi:hypothetical protein